MKNVMFTLNRYNPNICDYEVKQTNLMDIIHIPLIGESISTYLFKNIFKDDDFPELFLVKNVIIHYNDDMTEIDYTEIVISPTK